MSWFACSCICKSLNVACVLCEHYHLQQCVPFSDAFWASCACKPGINSDHQKVSLLSQFLWNQSLHSWSISQGWKPHLKLPFMSIAKSVIMVNSHRNLRWKLDQNTFGPKRNSRPLKPHVVLCIRCNTAHSENGDSDWNSMLRFRFSSEESVQICLLVNITTGFVLGSNSHRNRTN